MNANRRFATVALAATLALGIGLAARAATFVKDVMLIGGSADEVNALKTTLLGQGWTFIDYDLNKGCGSSSDYIYLLYKAGDTPGGNSCYGYVTGFYIKSGSDIPGPITSDGKTYYPVPYDGGEHFIGQNGDLNSHAGGDLIHLYYTKDAISPEGAVNSIWFNGSSSGAVGKNGSSDGYDLNKNAGGDFIYMHCSTGAASTTIDLSALAMDYTAASGITLTGTLTANYTVSVANGATVTLSNATIGVRSGLTAPGIACNGSATLTLAGANSVTGSGSVGISVPSGKTLTINGSGSLAATGTGNNAGIGSAGSSACGSITLASGTVTATKGGTEANSIGPSQSGASCGTITIGGVTTGPIKQSPITYSSTDTVIYTAAFDANGGTGSTAAITSRPNTPHQIPANGFTRAGYTFAVWNDAANGGGTSYDVDQWVILRDTTIYAQWSRNTYTIGYTLNGGSLPNNHPTSYNVDTATFTLVNPTRNHYTFAGWTWTGQTTPQISVTIPTGSTGDKAYTANWTPVTYAIGYDLAGGALPGGTSNPVSYNVTSSAIELVNPSRTGYTFAGWTWPGQATPKISVTIPTGSYGDKSYTANWTPVTYVVRFDANGAGGSMSDQTFTYDEAQNLRANAFGLTGHSHAGWSDSADGAVLYADGANVSNLTATAGTVVTLYAVWSQTPWLTLQKRLDQGGTIVLSSDVAKTDVDQRLVVTNAVTLDLNGHTLTGNGDSEVISVEGGNLTLTNSVEGAGSITGGARGVVVGEGAVFTMNGGTISGNAMPGFYGGGVYVSRNGTFTMTGGAISCNTAYSGGGVFVGYGIFTMSGGTISGNSAKYGGGGVSLISYSGSSSTFTMSGGTISGNASGDNTGGGVYADCAMHVSGTPVVSGNTNSVGAANNVYLATKKPIVIDGLRAGASIGVTAKYPPTGGGLVTIAEYGYGNARHFFSSDDPGYFLTDSYSDVCLRAPIPSSWEALQRQLDAGGAVTLADDVAAVDGDDPLLISGSVTLDLNGHTLAFNGGRFVVEVGSGGHLTLTNSVEGAGAVTGGSLGVRVRGGGTFMMTGGAISGNVANDDYGGGVYVDEYGAFTMTGGEISGNTSDWEGGGVYVEEYGTFTMSGGAIHGNSAFNGGGVFVEGAMAISGSPVISGNTNFLGEANNVYLEPVKALAVEGLSAGASIGVAIFTRDVFETVVVTEGAAAGDSRYFSSDVSGIVVDERNGEVCFTAPRTPWQTLQSQLDQGGTATLTDDISARAYDGALIVTNTVLLDLAGHTLMGYRGDLVIDVKEGGSLTLTNGVERPGSITGGVRGVLVEDGGVFTMAGGTISGNQAEDGGGVLVEGGGTFEMTGGEISGNTSYWEGGGGVYVAEYGTFTMSGGEISGNFANDGYGGGVYVDESGTFTMTGGEISGNTSDWYGGGVFMLWNSSVTMSGGTISANEAGYGGGVMISAGMFTMTGGTITGNVAHGDGGDEVRGSAAPCGGGGVYVSWGSTFTVSGNPVVSGNTNSVGAADNVCLGSWKVIAVDGLSAGASIGVTSEDKPNEGDPVILTDGAAAGDIAYFFSDDPGYHVELANGEVCLAVSMTWARLQSALDAGGTVTLPNDVAAGEGDTSLVVSGAVRLDLAGHTITGNGSNTVISIASGGDLTLTNSVPASGAITGGGNSGVYVGSNGMFRLQGGTISGNTATFGGGVHVGQNGTFTMTGGAISDNAATVNSSWWSDACGGGVYVDYGGTFEMNGGAISGNGARIGAGVYLNSVFTMNDGSISDNSAYSSSGGVYVDSNGTFEMNGGEISSNFTEYHGGGVFLSSGGVFAMNGGAISGNAARGDGGGVFLNYGDMAVSGRPVISGNTNLVGAANNVFFSGSRAMAINGLLPGTSIGIALGDWPDKPVVVATGAAEGDERYFSCDDMDNADVGFAEEGEVIFTLPTPPWLELQAALDAGGTVTLSNDCERYSFGPLTVTNTVVLDLNGHMVDGWWNRAFTICSGGNLTLTNSVEGAGAIVNGTESGVYVEMGGTFTMNGGTITGCGADWHGGGVFVDEGGAFTMNGGTISDNWAEEGAGVFVAMDGTFTMTGGTISDNVAYDGCGGGVLIRGTFTMTGGAISGNCSYYRGGGMSMFDGTVTVSGSPIISGNTNFVGETSNVYLSDGETIAVGGLSAGASIGVTTESLPTLSAPVVIATGADTGNGQYFFSDIGLGIDVESGEVRLVTSLSPWTALQIQLDIGGTVMLTNDCVARPFDDSLVVTNTVTLDLAGHMLTGKADRHVIYVGTGGNLTLTNSVEGTGAITGGEFGVYVDEYATFTMTAGEISGNTSDWNGGGVHVHDQGTFNMTGGTIVKNNAWNGGGVYVSWNSTFVMSGGTISGNKAGYGGGVYTVSAFTMTGGTISGNVGVEDSGGVCVVQYGAVMTLSGNPVVSANTNAAGEASNVYLRAGKTIAADGFSAGASIGVTSEIKPEEGNPVAIVTGAAAGDERYFFSDDPSNHVELVNGNLHLVVGAGLPAYLDGANELVIANYRAWAAKYGPDVTGAHEAAFLLDIDPATPIPAGAALLKIVDFRLTGTRMYIELASDVKEFEEKETEFPMLGNGFLAFRFALSLSSDPDDWVTVRPMTFEIRNGHAIYSLENDIGQKSGGGNSALPEGGAYMPSYFIKAIITDRAEMSVR